MSLPEMSKEPLHQVLGIMLAMAKPADVAIKRRPVDAEELRQALARPFRILRTRVADERPAGGGEE
jgi:hypothetical protein